MRRGYFPTAFGVCSVCGSSRVARAKLHRVDHSLFTPLQGPTVRYNILTFLRQTIVFQVKFPVFSPCGVTKTSKRSAPLSLHAWFCLWQRAKRMLARVCDMV